MPLDIVWKFQIIELFLEELLQKKKHFHKTSIFFRKVVRYLI